MKMNIKCFRDSTDFKDDGFNLIQNRKTNFNRIEMGMAVKSEMMTAIFGISWSRTEQKLAKQLGSYLCKQNDDRHLWPTTELQS